ncbi:MAG TPA: GumC family protein, partial [Nitrospirota bacterium]
MRKEEMGIRDYIMVISKRRTSVAVMFTVFVAAVAVVTFTMTPMYKATAQIYIDTGSASQFNLQQQSSGNFDNTGYLQTQINILKSDAIAKKVMQRLRLDQGDAPTEQPVYAQLFKLVGLSAEDDAGSRESDRLDAAAKKFAKRLDIEIVKNSSLVKVSYESEDPAKAANIANETVKAFIEQNLEMKVGPARDYMAWLDGELDKIKGRMNESSSQLENFKQSKDLLVPNERQASMSMQGLNDMNAKVLSAEAKRYEAEIKYQQVVKLARDPEGLMSVPEVINNRVIQDLKAQQGQLAKQMAEASKKYGEKHPQMVRLTNEMEVLKSQLQGEVSLIVNSIKNDYEEALHSESTMRRALGRQKAEAMNYERRSSEYEIRRQDVEGAKNIYEQVLKKMQEQNLMGTINVSNVQVFDKATPPKRPSSPKKALNIALGALLG